MSAPTRVAESTGTAVPGLTAQLVRIPERSTSFVILLLEYDEDRTGTLANAMIDELTT